MSSNIKEEKSPNWENVDKIRALRYKCLVEEKNLKETHEKLKKLNSQLGEIKSDLEEYRSQLKELELKDFQAASHKFSFVVGGMDD